ncbi:MAG: LysM peptidoglycan-binding domain-containing protein [Anaerolineae bacterium]|nr:LysM peptidoglycan-binding domain-containing protein [Anaerolineae bacterium]
MKRTTFILFLLLCFSRIASAQDDGGLVQRMNALRSGKGLPAYTVNSSLTAAAQSQAQWLVDNGCAIAHTHPDGSNPASRARAAGYITEWVGENIYCGGMAKADNAWTFFMNSPIHYAGLVNTRYKEVGTAVGHGAAGTSFVIVFGDPGGPAYVPPAAVGGKGSADDAPKAPPSYVVGVDAHGNIEHQIQSGDTLGQIALIYGYTWDDIPRMLALNGMSEADYRKLKEGQIFLVPPKAGTFTPTPDSPVANGSPDPAAATPNSNIPTPYPEETLSLIPDPAANAATIEPTLTAVVMVATSNSVPDGMVAFQPTSAPSPTTNQSIAMVSTGAPVVMESGVLPPTSSTPPWLIIALGVQMVVLVGAGVEYIRRHWKR